MFAELETGPGIKLVIEYDDGKTRSIEVPRPSVGWGGGEAVVSRSERYVAVVWDSGQSDAGYELFAVKPRLRRIGGLARVYGSGAIVAFSADDTQLAMLSAVEPMLGSEVDPEARELEWAELRVQALPNGPVAVCSVRTTLPPIEKAGSRFFYPRKLRFVAASAIELAGPSGAIVKVDLPLPKSVDVPPP